jgi:hypothetical protein
MEKKTYASFIARLARLNQISQNLQTAPMLSCHKENDAISITNLDQSKNYKVGLTAPEAHMWLDGFTDAIDVMCTETISRLDRIAETIGE